jgi:hypothetical protein
MKTHHGRNNHTAESKGWAEWWVPAASSLATCSVLPLFTATSANPTPSHSHWPKKNILILFYNIQNSKKI